MSDARLAVVDRPNRRQLRAARHAKSVCSFGTTLDSTAGVIAGILPKAPSSADRGPAKSSKPGRHREVLGARFAKRAISPFRGVPTWLYAMVAIALLLLGAGVFLPKTSPAGLVASLVFGMAGAITLLLATLAFALL